MERGVRSFAITRSATWRLSTRDRQWIWSDERKLLYLWCSPRELGLRIVGFVVPEPNRRNGHVFMEKNDIGHLGWFTNLDGEWSQGGGGLVWGCVFQLPGRKGVARMVAGYKVGGEDSITLDLSMTYEEATDECSVHLESLDAAYEAARAADDMAEHYARD